MLLLVNVAGTLTFDSTREQYESFPYPPIDPFERALLLHAQDQRVAPVVRLGDEPVVLVVRVTVQVGALALRRAHSKTAIATARPIAIQASSPTKKTRPT